MATVSKWNPFGVSLNLEATVKSISRISATQYKVTFNVSWETVWNTNTNFGMSASSGGSSVILNKFGTYSDDGSGTLTGTYSVSGNGKTTKSVTVTFTNYEEDWKGNVTQSKTKTITFSVSVPAWTSYTVKYDANGGSGAPSSQTKWKDQKLTLSSTKPTRTGYTFSKWNTKADGTGTSYSAGGSYTANAGTTLYAIWTANKYTITYDANGGTLGSVKTQTKTYGVTLALTGTATRTNYNFLGWSTSKTATTATYTKGSNFTSNANTTLYAVWELAYVKPSITSFSADRCDADGNPSDEGTYALVKFDWTTTYDVTSISVYLALANVVQDIESIDMTGKSGHVETIIGDGNLDVEHAYDVIVEVADSYDNNSKSAVIPGDRFAWDALPENKGIAFGGSAELENTADFKTYAVYPRVGFIYPFLPVGTDLNDVKTPNVYSANGTAASDYTNSPLTNNTTFTLEVYPCGSNGQVMQRLTTCSKDALKIYVRHYYSSSWGSWNEV